MIGHPRPRRAWLLASAVGLSLLGPLVPGATAAAAPSRPAAVVALGDSSASGEGAGDYEAGTRGEHGNWCHRSPHAYIRRTGLAATAVNLACSGATSADVGFGPAPATADHDPEGSQARRLVAVARRYRVTTVVAQLGANDDPGFGSAMTRCVAVFLSPGLPGCSDALAAQWPGRLAAMAPKAERALRDLREAMRQAGYRDQDYALVVASYPSPVTERMTRTHGLVGCPYRAEDARWGRTQAVPALAETLRGVAGRVGARFLDLSRATEGHEACTSAGPEWERRLTVNPKAFVSGGVAAVGHLAQESFHPNAVGHERVAGCLAEFVRGGAAQGRCVVGADGTLHAATSAPAPVG
ncbi:MAG TPA: GDSL-type esterase/lipase family protein [Pseudonocardia sp.]